MFHVEHLCATLNFYAPVRSSSARRRSVRKTLGSGVDSRSSGYRGPRMTLMTRSMLRAKKASGSRSGALAAAPAKVAARFG